jgi:hypothetical protein
MDQYLSSIIIAAITAIVSIVTLLINKSNDKITSKIDDQHILVNRETEIKAKISEKEKERIKCINEVMFLILDTNMSILNSEKLSTNIEIEDKTYAAAENLHTTFETLTKELQDLDKEYELVVETANEIKDEIMKMAHEDK